MSATIRFAACAALLLAAQASTAQQLFSAAHGNYTGLSGASWNPASIADNRFTIDIRLAGLDGHATNTGYRYTGPWTPLNNAEVDLDDKYLERQTNKKAKLFDAGLNLRGPGLMLRLNDKHSVAFGTRVRTAIQGNNLSEVFLQNAIDGFQTKGLSKGNSLNLNMNAFAEWDASYGRVVYNEGSHFLKAGVTVKRLMGMGSAYLQAPVLDYEVVPASPAIGDSTLRIQRLEASFGYSNANAFDDLDVNTVRSWLTGGNAPGSGWGADLGVVYEFRPDPDKYRYSDKKGRSKIDHSRNKYKYRLSVALVDMGSINYKEQAVAFNDIKTSKLNVSEADVKGIDLDNFDVKTSRILRTTRYQKQTSFRSKLPTALNIDADYHLWTKLYVNAALSQSLRGRNAIGMRTFSYAALTPRFETRWLELSTPLSLINNYQTVALGASVRIGPLTVGSNDLGALFASSNPYGASGYAEFSLFQFSNWRHKEKKSKSRLPSTTAPVMP
ncbi:hypothetical protein F0P96_09865 [Hymenobacter busanensis]|uniref:Uncharacterized protein n=1 Tax=Hymenobacter busanensis TaxID=2607656 RepID=A0A7L5A2N5_9BACT|nr:DUF5723 family protein [Hymenobacter busanensis]KAA9333273.1 hypothetical protein F0P96_09865 [Hymenobacter busanensis]QHJ08050.1 hypothetical protein GUY19_12455 [Hymenobacter busanensis]